MFKKYKNKIKLKKSRLDRIKTFMPLVFSLALRARLIPIFPLVLITWTADRKCTNITRNKRLAVGRRANGITADLTNLAAPNLFRRFLKKKKKKNHQITRTQLETEDKNKIEKWERVKLPQD